MYAMQNVKSLFILNTDVLRNNTNGGGTCKNEYQELPHKLFDR